MSLGPVFQEKRDQDDLLRQGKQHLDNVGRPSAKDATRAARGQEASRFLTDIALPEPDDNVAAAPGAAPTCFPGDGRRREEAWPTKSRLSDRCPLGRYPAQSHIVPRRIGQEALDFGSRNFIGSKHCRMAHLNHQAEPSAKLLARAASCDVTPRDRPVRLAGYAVAQDPGLDGPRPHRNFGPSAGMRRAALPDLQFRSHDRGIRASEHHPRQASAAGISSPTKSSCWRRTRTMLPQPIRLAQLLGMPDIEFVEATWPRLRKTLCARFNGNTASEVSLDGLARAAEPFHQPAPLLAVPDLWANVRVQVDERPLLTEPVGPQGRDGDRRIAPQNRRRPAVRRDLALHLPSDRCCSGERHQCRLPRNGAPRAA